jgi:hypothetical protein
VQHHKVRKVEETGAPFVISSKILRINGIVLGIVAKPLFAFLFQRRPSTFGQCKSRNASCFFAIAPASRIVVTDLVPSVRPLSVLNCSLGAYAAFINIVQ